MLSGKPQGSFLLFPSTTPFTIQLGLVSAPKQIVFQEVKVSEKGFTFGDQLFPTMKSLIEAHEKIFVHPILKSSSLK
jgi:hypothetical protein